MTIEKTPGKEFIEAVSVLQWVLSFLFLGKIQPSFTFANFKSESYLLKRS